MVYRKVAGRATWLTNVNVGEAASISLLTYPTNITKGMIYDDHQADLCKKGRKGRKREKKNK